MKKDDWEIGDRVFSVKNGVNTKAMGTVVDVTDTGIWVEPDQLRGLGMGYIYDFDGVHEEDKEWSVIKEGSNEAH